MNQLDQSIPQTKQKIHKLFLETNPSQSPVDS